MPRKDLPKDWERRREMIFMRDNSLCTISGPRCMVAATEVDHIVPREEGGGHELHNLRAVCQECHKDRRRSRISSKRWF